MTENVMKNYPIPSIQRLPVYLRFLKEQQQKGEKIVSCTRIAEEFGQLSVQVRKDLAITGITGRPKVGYSIDDLIRTISSFLGWDVETKAFLIGAGSLGSAILGYKGFLEHNLRILNAFDVSPQKVGTTIHGCRVRHLEELINMKPSHKIDIGILTVPAEAAQYAADLLIRIGVRGIWNYTPIRLELPQNVVCEQVKLSASFALLSSTLRNKFQ